MNRLNEPQQGAIPYVAADPAQRLPLLVAVEMIAERCADCDAAVKVRRPSISGARKTLGGAGLGLRIICPPCAELLRDEESGQFISMIVAPSSWCHDIQQGDLQ